MPRKELVDQAVAELAGDVMAATKYSVRFERDEGGWWVASATSVPGVHTQGRTVAQARERIREALSAAEGVGSFELDEQYVLTPDLDEQLRNAHKIREEAEELQRRAQDAARSAALAFANRGVSTRDAGDLLHLSHQRVHQLLRSGARKTSASRWQGAKRGRRK